MPERQKPPRRHHTVSKFYLRHFADSEDRVATVALPGDNRFTQSIENASVHIDFNTALGLDGEQTTVAEEAFGYIETDAAEAWRAVAGGIWPL